MHGLKLCMVFSLFIYGLILWDSLHLHSEKVSKVVYDIFGSW